MPFLGLAPSSLSNFRGWGHAMSSSDAMPLCGRGGAIILYPRVMSLLLPLAPLSSLAHVVGGFCPFPTPVFPPPSLPHPRWPFRGFHPHEVALPPQGH